MNERTDIERELNLGETVKTKSLGEVVVKELVLEDVLVLSKDISKLLQRVISYTDDGAEGTEIIFSLVQEPDFLVSVKKIAAAATDKEIADFEGLPASDWLRIVGALKRVVNWEELKDLFFQVVPREASQNLIAEKGTIKRKKAPSSER